MTTQFWIGAAALSAAALAFLLWPVWRQRSESGQWSIGGIAAAACMIPVTAWLYSSVTTWQGEGGSAVVNPDQLAIVEQLAQRMQQNPDDVEGWVLLGRSYLTLQQYVPARQAFLQAWQRMQTPDNALKLGLGMAMIHSDRSTIGAEGGQLIEEVLQSEPNNQQALWYGGLVALERGRQDTARDRWAALLAMGPPPDVAQVLEQQIAMLGDSIDGSSLGAANTAARAQRESASAAPTGTVIRLRIDVADELSQTAIPPTAQLFIFARNSAGGPPLAVVRKDVSAIPGEFMLSDADTMIAGNSLGNFTELTLVARISMSGQPIEQSGDLYAEAEYDTASASSDVFALTINNVVP